MTEASQKMLEEFQQLEWFSNVGQSVGSANVKRVESWDEALDLCQSRYSDSVQLESRNLLTEKLCFEHIERYRKWNQIVSDIRKKVDLLLKKKVFKSPHCPKLPNSVQTTIRLDLLGTLMELEYADLIPPRFFAERDKWYLAGHFPCGWDGDFPQGRLVVY